MNIPFGCEACPYLDLISGNIQEKKVVIDQINRHELALLGRMDFSEQIMDLATAVFLTYRPNHVSDLYTATRESTAAIETSHAAEFNSLSTDRNTAELAVVYLEDRAEDAVSQCFRGPQRKILGGYACGSLGITGKDYRKSNDGLKRNPTSY